WDGYPASRDRLLAHLEASRVSNPVVISGDLHSFWVNALKKSFDDPGSPTVATELVGTSISAIGPSYSQFMRCMPDNPHLPFFERRRAGYAAVESTPEGLTADLRVLSNVQDPQATVSPLRRYVVESGRSGALPA